MLKSGIGGRYAPYLCIFPALAMSLSFIGFPLAQTAWYSLHAWDGISAPEWRGLQNYAQVLASANFQQALQNVGVLLVFFCIIPVSAGLVTAAIISRRKLPGMGFFRSVLFLPQVIALVVTGMAWRWMYSFEGVINQILTAVGLEDYTRIWLGDFDWALLAVGLVMTWVASGFSMVLFLSGIARIDSSLYDAARIDGAGPVAEFFAVTLPGVKQELGVAVTITLVGGLRAFDVVYVTTAGGPGTATTVPAFEIYVTAFRDQAVGQAAAMAVLLTAMILAAVLILRRIMGMK
ncbi:carbohydrate ABC transporter permease [Poseidonocella sp. HB161398]|uniref:carbohydrate ABC transporter permease n=1 Tax=Poseidonocella sp. HB161398 TaxID=2320855 RepID=UPI00197DF618|nr:sugar ABC transporter permease [Poseidonocella sp. HB161398]